MSTSTLRSRTAGTTSRPQHASHASQASISSTASSTTLAGRGGSSDRVSSTTAVEAGRNEGGEPKGDIDRPEAWTLHAPLPAVKGTFGGINSPGRRHLHSPSLNTFRATDSPAPYPPSIPATPITPSRSGPNNPSSGGDDDRQQDQDESPPAPPRRTTTVFNPDAPVFRADPTVKSCFDSLMLDKAAELKALFNA